MPNRVDPKTPGQIPEPAKPPLEIDPPLSPLPPVDEPDPIHRQVQPVAAGELEMKKIPLGARGLQMR